eukprot:TRINITY_DN20782_c0_g1_i5.p1 TRINITY_DN20782_c0_g1~~TRINITY_DN20782_c0_g1_i5.p1  ORF type:complete len:136 (-),score=14.67 TRINITY_DN20782_c0_g1_i5:302-709(-)
MSKMNFAKEISVIAIILFLQVIQTSASSDYVNHEEKIKNADFCQKLLEHKDFKTDERIILELCCNGDCTVEEIKSGIKEPEPYVPPPCEQSCIWYRNFCLKNEARRYWTNLRRFIRQGKTKKYQRFVCYKKESTA